MHARVTLRDRVEMLQNGLHCAHQIIRERNDKAAEDKARIAELEAEVARLRALLPPAGVPGEGIGLELPA